MSNIKAGDTIGVQCIVQDGPFPGEHLIQIDTLDGPISGFVVESNLRQRDGIWLVRGEVVKVFSDRLEVLVEGSFFTTNGLANIPSQLAMAA